MCISVSIIRQRPLAYMFSKLMRQLGKHSLLFDLMDLMKLFNYLMTVLIFEWIILIKRWMDEYNTWSNLMFTVALQLQMNSLDFRMNGLKTALNTWLKMNLPYHVVHSFSQSTSKLYCTQNVNLKIYLKLELMISKVKLYWIMCIEH